MKKLLLGILLITAWGCSPNKSNEHAHEEGQESHHEMSDHSHEGDDAHDHGEMMEDDMHVEDGHAEHMVAQLDIDPEFHQQLNALFDSSMDLKDAYIASDREKIKNTVSKVIDQMGNVDAKLLGTNAHEIWMNNLKDMAHLLSKIEQSNSLEEQRKSFALYNKALYRSFKFLGHEGETIYYQHCPMAFNNKGAYWLSNTKEIRNPYFGDEMLTCGSTKEEIN